MRAPFLSHRVPCTTHFMNATYHVYPNSPSLQEYPKPLCERNTSGRHISSIWFEIVWVVSDVYMFDECSSFLDIKQHMTVTVHSEPNC